MTFLTPRLEAFFYGGIETLRLDARVFAFSLGASLLSGVLLGLLPALQASRPNLVETLKASGRGSSGGAKGRRMRDVLMVSQVALAVTLSIGAGLMIRSLWTLQQVDRGLNTGNVLTMQIWPPEKKYAEPHEIANFYRRIVEGLEDLPETTSSNAINFLHLSEVGIGWTFAIEGKPIPLPEGRPGALYYVVTPGYLQAMQIPLLRGRYLTACGFSRSPRRRSD